jgi:hypothetical protein
MSRQAAVLCLWAIAALSGGLLCARAAAQVTTPTEPTTQATSTQAPPTPAPTTRPATTRPTVVKTVPRRSSTTGPPTTPPTTVPTTVAGTLPPTTAGNVPAQSTLPVEDTRPGEGKMPAWPLVLSGVGFAGAAGILGWHWFNTRPG